MTDFTVLRLAKAALVNSAGTPTGQFVHLTADEFGAVLEVVNEALRKAQRKEVQR